RGGQPLRGAELDIDLVVVERGIVAVAEQLAQPRQDLLETLVHLRIGGPARARRGQTLLARRSAGRRGRLRRVRGQENAHLEVHGAFGRGDGGGGSCRRGRRGLRRRRGSEA